MNYTLIMLDIPVLVSDEFDERGRKIIAGFFGKPKLDLSLIADGIGWVDVEKLANDHIYSMQNRKLSPLILGAKKLSFIDGFKTHQSLNEKKYSLEDMRHAWEAGMRFIGEDKGDYSKMLMSLSKTKEYLVEVEMQTLYFDGTRWVDSLPKKFIDKLVKTKVSPKITNNTIKVTKILN